MIFIDKCTCTDHQVVEQAEVAIAPDTLEQVEYFVGVPECTKMTKLGCTFDWEVTLQMRDGSPLNTTLFSVDQSGLVTIEAPMLAHKNETTFELEVVMNDKTIHSQAAIVVSQLDVIEVQQEI